MLRMTPPPAPKYPHLGASVLNPSAELIWRTAGIQFPTGGSDHGARQRISRHKPIISLGNRPLSAFWKRALLIADGHLPNYK